MGLAGRAAPQPAAMAPPGLAQSRNANTPLVQNVLERVMPERRLRTVVRKWSTSKHSPI